MGHGPYIVRHEPEAGGGFIDIAFEPQLGRWPTIGYAAIIELKYFKKGDAVTPETLAKVRADALAQMAKYAKDKDIARRWNLKPIPGVTDGVAGGTVELKRILIVFHGGDVVVCDEVGEI